MSDPFIQTSDAGALRSEIKRLQQENMSLKQASLQQKLKLEMAGKDATKKGGTGKGSSAGGGDAAAADTKLKEEVARLKKDLQVAQSERERAVQEKEQHQQLLEAVSVAACEREQRLRTLCCDVQQRLDEAVQRLETQRAQPPPVPAAAPAPPPVPVAAPPPPQPALPVKDIQRTVDLIKDSLLELEMLCNVGPQGGPTTTGRSTKRGGVSRAAERGQRGDVPPHANDDAASSSHTAATMAAPPATTAPPQAPNNNALPQGVGAASSVAGSAAPRRGRPPKGSSSSLTGGERPTKQRRIDTVTGPVASQRPPTIAVQDLVAEEARRRNAQHRQQGGAEQGSDKTTVQFSEDPFEDTFALQAALPASRRQMALERLSAQLYLHFGKSNAAVASALVQHFASTGQRWSEDKRETTRRAVVYAELLQVCGGAALLDAWVVASIAFLLRMMDPDHLHADHTPQLVPVATALRVMCKWRSDEEKRHVLRGTNSSSSSSLVAAEFDETPFVASYVTLVGYLQTVRQGQEGTLLEPASPHRRVGTHEALAGDDGNMPLASDLKQLTTVLQCLLDTEGGSCCDTGGREDGALLSSMCTVAGASPARGSLLWVTTHCVVVDLLVKRRAPVKAVHHLCDALGWSRSQLPLPTIRDLCIKASLLHPTENHVVASGAANSSATVSSAMYALRLLVLYEGLPLMETITAQWKALTTTPQRSSSSSASPNKAAQQSRLGKAPAEPTESSVECALVLLLSFVAMDFGVRDDRDGEWEKMTTFLQEFIAGKASLGNDAGGAASSGMAVAATCAAGALMYMANPSATHDEHLLSAADGNGPISAAKLLVWQQTASWYLQHSGRVVDNATGVWKGFPVGSEVQRAFDRVLQQQQRSRRGNNTTTSGPTTAVQ